MSLRSRHQTGHWTTVIRITNIDYQEIRGEEEGLTTVKYGTRQTEIEEME